MLLLSSVEGKSEAFWKFSKEKKNPRVVAVFVDMSGSTNQARRTVYRNAFEKIYENLQQGDRIMVGTITGRSYIDFKPAVDAEIPEQSLWVNRITFEQNRAQTKKDIQSAVEKLLSAKRGTPRTEIINSLNIADKIFHNEKRQKILIILSDMIQDSKEYNFDRVKVTDDYITKIIRERQKQNLIPKLNNVKVYVAGASAADSKKFRSIEKFWNRYFVACGADFSLQRYGHSLLEFEKET
jgi:Mg-chelatase subunit ChlD